MIQQIIHLFDWSNGIIIIGVFLEVVVALVIKLMSLMNIGKKDDQ